MSCWMCGSSDIIQSCRGLSISDVLFNVFPHLKTLIEDVYYCSYCFSELYKFYEYKSLHDIVKNERQHLWYDEDTGRQCYICCEDTADVEYYIQADTEIAFEDTISESLVRFSLPNIELDLSKQPVACHPCTEILKTIFNYYHNKCLAKLADKEPEKTTSDTEDCIIIDETSEDSFKEITPRKDKEVVIDLVQKNADLKSYYENSMLFLEDENEPDLNDADMIGEENDSSVCANGYGENSVMTLETEAQAVDDLDITQCEDSVVSYKNDIDFNLETIIAVEKIQDVSCSENNYDRSAGFCESDRKTEDSPDVETYKPNQTKVDFTIDNIDIIDDDSNLEVNGEFKCEQDFEDDENIKPNVPLKIEQENLQYSENFSGDDKNVSGVLPEVKQKKLDKVKLEKLDKAKPKTCELGESDKNVAGVLLKTKKENSVKPKRKNNAQIMNSESACNKQFQKDVKNDNKTLSNNKTKHNIQTLSSDKINHTQNIENNNSSENQVLSGEVRKLKNAENYSFICTSTGGAYKCGFCIYICEDEQIMNRHVFVRHLKKKSFPCTQCLYIGDTASRLKVHMIRHKKREPTSTVGNYSPKDYWNYHCKEKQSDQSTHELFFCYHCDFSCQKKLGLVSHIENIHKKTRLLTCPYCPHQGRRQAMNNHILQKHRSFKIKCKFCAFETKFLHCMDTHIESRHKGPRRRCKLCSFSCHLIGDLAQHMREQHSKKDVTFSCRRCSYTTNILEYFKQHYEKTHPKSDIVFKCIICQYETDQLTHFELHFRCCRDNEMDGINEDSVVQPMVNSAYTACRKRNEEKL